MRRREVNPGEMFAISDKVILMREFESIFGMTSQFGPAAVPRLTYALTFNGKLNRSGKKADVTVLIAPEDLMNMVSTMVDQLEWLQGVLGRRSQSEGEAR